MLILTPANLSVVVILIHLFHILFAVYFLICLLTITPFLPHPSSYPALSFPHLFLFAYVPILPVFLFPAIAAVPQIVSYTLAVLVALRFAINAPLGFVTDVSLRHYPRLLLWRFDVLLYFVFFCICVMPSIAITPYVLLAFAAIFTTLLDVYTRVRRLGPTPSLRDVLFQAFPRLSPPQELVSVPPTIREASVFTILFFRWVTPTVVTGHRRSLEADDIKPLSHRFSTQTADNHFKQFWEKELQLCPPKQPSLSRALFLAYWRHFLPTFVLGYAVYPLAYASPIFLRLIIIHLQDRENGLESPWRGFLLTCGLFVVSFCQSVGLHQFLDQLCRLESLLRAAMISRVYEKTTILSPQSRDMYTSGQIQNLMATDVQNISELPLDVGFLATFFLQVCLTFALLVNFSGWIPSLAGIVLMASYVPLQAHLVRITKTFRETASSFTDERVKIVSEVIRGIKLIKLYAWELSFVKRISQAREKELHHIRKASIVGAWNTILVISFPIILALTVFTAYAITGRVLDAAIVFPVISVFNVSRGSVSYLPAVLVQLARTSASLSRLKSFLCADQLKPLNDGAHAVDQNFMELNKIDLAANKASFAWNASTSPLASTISSASFQIPEGSFVAVVGPTGSGKSTLLAGLLGEVPILSGKAGIRKTRSVSFCDQVPFIQNATVRDNILFGKPFEEEHYHTTIRVSSLEPDLELLPGRDLTEIGSRGVNLSGGQRARIALARAVYSRSDVILLDDPLCAVDAHVGRSIFRDCLVSQLRGTTRLLTTNQIHYATSPAIDLVIVVKDGRVVESGSRSALLSCRSSEFAKLVQATGEIHAREIRNAEMEDLSGTTGIQVDDLRWNGNMELNRNVKMSLLNSKTDETNSLVNGVTRKNYGSIKNWRFTQHESKEEGRVQIKHYALYIGALGPLRWVLPFLLFMLCVQIASLSVNIWLSLWSEQSNADHTLINLVIFVLLSVVTVLLTGGSMFSITFGSLRASKILHKRLLLSVLGAPSSFFHTTPDGRIINRFHSDMDKVDSILAPALNSFIRMIFGVAFAIGLLVWATPALSVVVVPIAAICIYVQEVYRRTSVDLRRLNALSRSPLYSHVGETLEGIVTIRAYRNVSREKHFNSVLADKLNKIDYATWHANRWLGLRLESLSVILIATTVALAVFTSPGRLSASLTGLALSYTTQIVTALTWTVRTFTDVESNLSSVERISEFSESPFPQEEQGGLQGLLKEQKEYCSSLPNSALTEVISTDGGKQDTYEGLRYTSRWPRRGKIDFDGVLMRYRSDLEPALKNVSFSVQPGEHIGIVGRTGAGKTSTIQCLFRLHELEKGRILIDGTDISTIRLFDLRSSLGIIPQEPVCFSGTVRSNLDMEGDHDDVEVQESLDSCGLQETMNGVVSLDDEVSENGCNLSVGQRQLLCLGRALLKNSQVLILDEATSSVTNATDEAIQKTLREKMRHCTIFTVAHRLHTVMKCDRIIVMDKGRTVEIGKPSELLKRKSWLKALVDETGHATAAHLRRIASVSRKGRSERNNEDGFCQCQTDRGIENSRVLNS